VREPEEIKKEPYEPPRALVVSLEPSEIILTSDVASDNLEAGGWV